MEVQKSYVNLKNEVTKSTKEISRKLYLKYKGKKHQEILKEIEESILILSEELPKDSIGIKHLKTLSSFLKEQEEQIIKLTIKEWIFTVIRLFTLF